MVTVRTRKLWTCLPGTPRWIVGWQQTSAGTRKLFLADQSSHPSSAFRFASGILGHWHSWGQVFPGPLERIVGPAERAVLHCLSFFIYLLTEWMNEWMNPIPGRPRQNGCIGSEARFIGPPHRSHISSWRRPVITYHRKDVTAHARLKAQNFRRRTNKQTKNLRRNVWSVLRLYYVG